MKFSVTYLIEGYKKGGIFLEDKIVMDLDTLIAYAELATHTLKNSGTEITPKEIKSEIKMLQKKFGMKEVIRLANIIEKEKK